MGVSECCIGFAPLSCTMSNLCGENIELWRCKFKTWQAEGKFKSPLFVALYKFPRCGVGASTQTTRTTTSPIQPQSHGHDTVSIFNNWYRQHRKKARSGLIGLLPATIGVSRSSDWRDILAESDYCGTQKGIKYERSCTLLHAGSRLWVQ